MDPNNKKDQKNNQNRNRNMRPVVTLIIWALVLDGGVQLSSTLTATIVTKRASSHEIPYSQLIDLIQEDQVADAEDGERRPVSATQPWTATSTPEATDKNKEPEELYPERDNALILYTTRSQ